MLFGIVAARMIHVMIPNVPSVVATLRFVVPKKSFFKYLVPIICSPFSPLPPRIEIRLAKYKHED